MAMRCRAALSWRFPERLNRTRPAVLPDHTGIGAVPVWRAKAASLRKRETPAVSPMILAAVSSPQPGPGQTHDIGELIAGQFGQHPGLGVQPGSQPLARVGAVQRTRLGFGGGIELVDALT
jgi:hypothetical protein